VFKRAHGGAFGVGQRGHEDLLFLTGLREEVKFRSLPFSADSEARPSARRGTILDSAEQFALYAGLW